MYIYTAPFFILDGLWADGRKRILPVLRGSLSIASYAGYGMVLLLLGFSIACAEGKRITGEVAVNIVDTFAYLTISPTPVRQRTAASFDALLGTNMLDSAVYPGLSALIRS